MSTTQERIADRQSSAPTQFVRPTWLEYAVYPFHNHFVNLDGNRLHYIDEGNGPTLLFLHANPLWSFQYRHLIMPLRSHFRCIALDYPGFGLSEARPGLVTTLAGNSELVEHFIQFLNLNEITLVAHDASVSIGLGVVMRQPAWFRALIISNGFAWPLSEDPSINRFLKVLASPPFRTLLINFNLLMRWTVANFDKLSEAERHAYLMPHADKRLRHHQHDFFHSIIHSDQYLSTLRSRLPEIAHFPVLLLFADNDPTYMVGWMQRYEHIFPHHDSVRVEGSHHFPQEYNPAMMVQAIITWAAKELATSTLSRSSHAAS